VRRFDIPGKTPKGRVPQIAIHRNKGFRILQIVYLNIIDIEVHRPS
jgi:hypothetical protein